MAIYTLNVSSTADLRQSIVDALDDAGILTTTHYNTTNDVIVTTTRSNKVIRFQLTSLRPIVYIGDAYSSGTTITNPLTIMAGLGSSAIEEAVIIVTGNLLLFACRYPTDVHGHAVFSRDTSVSARYLALGWSSYSTSCNLKNTSDDEDLHILSFAAPVISPAGKYYETDLPVVDNSNVLIADGIEDLKCITRSSVATVISSNYADVIVVSGGGTRGLAYYFRSSFVVEDAVEWPPEE